MRVPGEQARADAAPLVTLPDVNALPLTGFHVLCLGVNLPAPAAATRLGALGAHVTKIEPPTGDPLAHQVPLWYAELTRTQTILQLDLKDRGDRARLDELLDTADLLLTSFRPQALARLRLAPDDLANRFPELLHVAIVGYPPPNDNVPGHDLTYQASLGLLAPPALPKTLLADLAGVEQAVSAALALALARERGLTVRHVQVALSAAAEAFAAPLRYGVTTPGGYLGGGFPLYGLYQAKVGWVAVAALEPHFGEAILRALGLEDTTDVASVFGRRTASEWEDWAVERDLPICAVPEGIPPHQVAR